MWPLFDIIGLHVDRRTTPNHTLARNWMKNLWIAFTEVGRQNQKREAANKMGSLMVGKIVVQRNLHKVTDIEVSSINLIA